MKKENYISINNVPNDVSVQYRMCWNCNTITPQEFLKESDSIIVCSTCGKSYFKGKEIVQNSNINQRKRRKNNKEM